MKTSIIILTHNQWSLTRQCLESIRKHTPEEHEIIVVDNASTDETVEQLKQLSDIQLICNDENLGFAKGCNQGFQRATGDLILFLNNDTVVTQNWLKNMIRVLTSEERIGMVGPVTNFCSGPQQITVSYQDLSQLDSFAQKHCQRFARLAVPYPRLVGFCLLVKRTLIEEIGLFDERFGIGSFEDDDFCLRTLKSGYTSMIVYDSFVHHVGHATLKQMDDQDLLQLVQENQRKAKEKWGQDIYSLLLPEYRSLSPLVSICIPVGYSFHPKRFQLALQSAQAQSYKRIEIFILDNTSNPEAEKMVHPYSQSDQRIKYIRTEKKMGYIQNLFHFIQLASGEFITLLREDEMIHPQKVEKMMQYFIHDTNKEVSFITSCRQMITEEGNRLPFIQPLFANDAFVDGKELAALLIQYEQLHLLGGISAPLFRKEDASCLKESANPIDLQSVEHTLWVHLLKQGKIIYIAEPLSFYRFQHHPVPADGKDPK